MSVTERIFHAICKASVYILISAFCVAAIYALYYMLKNAPLFVLGTAGIALAVGLVLNGFYFLNEDMKKRENELNKEIEQLYNDIKQHSDEMERCREVGGKTNEPDR